MPTITEDDAIRAFQAAKAFPDDEGVQTKVNAIRDAYKRQQEAAGAPMFPNLERSQAEQRAATRRLYQDRETHGLDPETFEKLGATLRDRPEEKFEVFNERFFSESFGLSKEQVRTMRRELIASYSSKTWGEEVTDDRAFYDRQAADFDFEDAVARKATAAALSDMGPLDAFADLETENAGNANYTGRRKQWRDQFSEIAAAERDRLAPYKPTVRAVADILQAKTGTGGEGTENESYRQLAGYLMEVPKEDREFVIAAIAAAGANDEAGRKGAMQKLAESFGRGLVDYRENIPANLERSWALGLRNQIEAGFPVSAEDAADPERLLAVATSQMKTATAAGMAPGGDLAPSSTVENPAQIPDEVKAQALALADELIDGIDLRAKLRGAAENQIDPVTSDWMPARGLYSAARSMPYTLAAIAPGGFVLNSIAMSETSYQQLRAANPDMTAGQAQAIASFSGPLQAGLERISGKVLTGKLPSFNRFANQVTVTQGAALRRFGARAGAAAGIEMVQENVQDLTPFFVQEAFAALSEDIPSVPWEPIFGDMAKNQGEIFFSVLPLALIGAGAGTVRDFKGAREMLGSYDMLRAVGLTEATASEVRAKTVAGDLEGAQALLRSGFREIGADQKALSEARAEAIPKLIEERERVRELVNRAGDLDMLPAIRNEGGGMFSLQYSDGSGMSFATYEEADSRRWQVASDENLSLHQDTISTIRRLDSDIEAGRETKYLFSLEDPTLADMIAKGDTSEEAAAQRLQIAEQEYSQATTAAGLAGVSQEDRMASARILGSSVNEFRDEVIRTTIRLYQGATPLTLIEEKTEGDAKFMIQQQGLRKWMLSSLRAWEQASGDKLFRGADEATDQDIIEAWSSLTQAYFVGRSKKGDQGPVFTVSRKNIAKLLSSPLGSAMTAYTKLFQSVWKRAALLEKARRDGTLDEDLEGFLAKSTGMSEQRLFEREVVKEGAQVAEGLGDPGPTFSILPSAVRPVFSSGNADAADNAARDPHEAFRVLSGAETLHRRGSGFASAAKRRKHGRRIAGSAELEAFARESGLILDPAPLAELFATKAIIGGGEHNLFFDEESQRFIKVTKPDLYGFHGDDAGAYLERLALSNITFGDDIAFEGIVKLPGEDGYRAVISQPFYPGRDATPKEVSDYLNGLGFHLNKKGGIWTHPVTGISVRDTDTPGNVIALEGGGFQAVDLIVSPALEEDLQAARDSTGIKGIGGDGATFSLLPDASNLDTEFARMFSPFQRSPELRMKLGMEMARRVAEQVQKLRPILRANRTKKSIEAERKKRQDDLFSEKLDLLSAGEVQALSNGNLLEDNSPQPILSELLNEKTRKTKGGKTVKYWQGSLMSKSEAKRRGIDTTGGEWDAIPEGLPPYVYGGSITPDRAASMFGFERPELFFDALAAEIQARADRKAEIEGANRRVRELEKEARDESRAWAEQAMQDRETVGSDRKTLLGFLRTLDAITRALPAEVRGKIGGSVALAKLVTPSAMLDEIESRVEKIDAELERWMKSEADRQVKKLFETAKPAKDQAGKARKGKAGADIHDLFDTARQAWKNWTTEKAEGHALGIEAEIAKGELSPEMEAHKLLEAELVRAFGGWNQADSVRKNHALDTATEIWREGYHAFKLKKAAEKERRDGIRSDLRADTGKSGKKSERALAELAGVTLPGRAKDFFLSLLNFEQLTAWAFGKDSKWARWFADEQRKAENAKLDAVQSVVEGIEDIFTEMAGGDRFKGEQLQFRMMQRSITATAANGDVVPLSELEALSALLMWQQEDGKRHLRGKRDEDGNLVSEWSYDDGFIEEISGKLSPEAWRVLGYLQSEYGKEYEPLNAVYRDIYGINLPRNPNYSPLLVKPQQASAGQTQDPVTGTTASAGSFTPGSLRTRAQISAEPDFRDAVATFIAHKKQIEHWKANARFMLDANAILGNRELGNSIEAAHGQEAVKIIRKWLDAIAQGGTRDAAAGIAAMKTFEKMTGRAASMALVGRIGTLAIQSTQLGAAAALMPTGAYVVRLGKLLSGNLGWGKALASPYIQRRLAQQPVMVQAAMEGLRAGKPSQLKHQVRRIGSLLNGADALFTAGTFAMVHDYHFREAIRGGMTENEADMYASETAERVLESVAQPTRLGTRSFFEVSSSNPFARLAWAFASDARKNAALLGFNWAKGSATEKARATLFVIVLNGLISGVIRSAWRDLRDDEDEEVFDEKYWSAKRLALSTSTDWLFGFPVIGEELQRAIYSAAGEYTPDSGLLSAVSQAPGAIKNLLEGDSTDTLRDVEKILTAVGLFSDNAAAATSVMHIIRDLYGLGENLIPD